MRVNSACAGSVIGTGEVVYIYVVLYSQRRPSFVIGFAYGDNEASGVCSMLAGAWLRRVRRLVGIGWRTPLASCYSHADRAKGTVRRQPSNRLLSGRMAAKLVMYPTIV